MARPGLADHLLGYFGLARVAPAPLGVASGEPLPADKSSSPSVLDPPRSARQLRTLGDPIVASGIPEPLGSTLWTTVPRVHADGGTVGSLTVRAASICGRRHASTGATREDAFAIRPVTNGTVVVAVADGVGDRAARFSAVGAHVAALLSCQAVVSKLETGQPVDPLGVCAQVSARMPAEARRFTRDPPDNRSLATTLITAWVSPGGAYRGFMVGDGGVFELADGRASVIASSSTFADPVTLPSGSTQLEEFSGTLIPQAGLLLATDGLSTPMLSSDVASALGQSWRHAPALLDFLYDMSFERRGEADDRTGASVWFVPPCKAP